MRSRHHLLLLFLFIIITTTALIMQLHDVTTCAGSMRKFRLNNPGYHAPCHGSRNSLWHKLDRAANLVKLLREQERVKIFQTSNLTKNVTDAYHGFRDRRLLMRSSAIQNPADIDVGNDGVFLVGFVSGVALCALVSRVSRQVVS